MKHPNMKQSSLIKLVDLVSFITLLVMISTGVLLEYSLPARSGGASILGLTRHDWGDVHFYNALLFLLLMAAHLITHGKYIRSAIVGKASREHGFRVVIGIVSLILLVLIAFAPVVVPVEQSDTQGFRHGRQGP